MREFRTSFSPPITSGTMTNMRPHKLTLAAILAANNATAASKATLAPAATISPAAFADIITTTEPVPAADTSSSHAAVSAAPAPAAAEAPAVNCQLSTVNSPASAPNPQLSILNSQLALSPADFFRKFLSHHCRHDFNPMHLFSFEQYAKHHTEPLPHRTGRRLAIAAPRGAAKSTVHTLLFPIMDFLYGRERHQVIISGTLTQAKNRLATISHELRNNQLIRDTFFGGKVPKFKVNSKRIELNGCCIEAFSAGSELRGISHGEYRPTRIILDDVEQSRNATKAYHRNNMLKWYDEVVENLGDNYTHITIVGTILHTDSLLSTLLNRPGYKGQLYRSIQEWDSCPELWRQWQRIYTDKSLEDASESALEFFLQHEDEMTAGTSVLWPSKESYYILQQRLLTLGRCAFFKEKQNQPLKDGSQIFDTGLWQRFISPEGYIQVMPQGLTLEQQEAAALARRENCAQSPPAAHRLDELKYYGFLDPAMGKATSRDGDYAAIVTVAKAPDNTLYVMNVWMEKASPMKQVEQIFALHERYRYQKFGYESNGFQETLGKFIREEQERRRRDGSHWTLPITDVKNVHNKHSRISLLEPHILAGSILFQQDLPHQFYIQADEYDGHRNNHDDGLDALASCVEMIRGMHPAPISGIKHIRRHPNRRGF